MTKKTTSFIILFSHLTSKFLNAEKYEICKLLVKPHFFQPIEYFKRVV